MKRLGFIGYGLRSETMMKAFSGIAADIEVAAIADPNREALKPSLAADSRFQNTVYYEDAEQMLNNQPLDGVFIGTRCNLHARYAQMVLEKSIPLFLEKPVCINEEQYLALCKAGAKTNTPPVVVSFPLRFTCIVQHMKHLVDSGVLGDVVTVQAINNVPYGSVYYHSWYRNPDLTGGLFLQKATHDIDYITYILGKHPVKVAAQTAKMHFKGERRENLRCQDCPEYHSCPESSFVVKHYQKSEPSGEWCCFAKDTGNEDVGAALFQCEDGTIISYHQVFLVKNNAGRRGARFIGTKASAEFDFYTFELKVDYYDGKHTAIHQFEYPKGLYHFGGDEELAKEFMAVLNGSPSSVDLKEGLFSAGACLAAKKSACLQREVPISYEWIHP